MVGGRGSPIGDRRNWGGYIVDGKEVRLTPQMGLRMQGFPERFEMPVSDAQAMKQLGNSVAVPAVQASAQAIIERLNEGRLIDELERGNHQRVRG
jgi:DNA (cytosine-5)-methyltransferase 1